MNRLDTLISRKPFSRTRTMQEHDDTNETSTPVGDTTNGSKSNVWERRMTIAFIAMASIGLIVCTGLLIQAYITQKPAFQLVDYSFYKPGFELLVYYSLLFLLAGFFTLMIASNIHTIFERKQKKFSYILAAIATISIFLSLGLLLISRKPEQEWWGYFSVVTWGTSLIITNFQKLINLKRKDFSSLLELISYVLMLVAFLFSLLAIRDEEAITISNFWP